jgi:putative NIF3 family GTP cyclohydrolase 1 type 2
VDEIRLEMVMPRHRMAQAIAAIRSTHPYEEPAFDVYPLEAPPDAHLGQGRIGRFSRPMTLGKLAQNLARKLGSTITVIIGDKKKQLKRGLVCVGSAGSFPFEIGGAPDVVLTGEIRHHDALRYERAGLCAIALGHWTSERPVLRPLADTLKKMLPRSTITISRADREPFVSP